MKLYRVKIAPIAHEVIQTLNDTGLIEVSWPGQPFLDRTIAKGDALLVSRSVRFFHGRQLHPRTIGGGERRAGLVVERRAGAGIAQRVHALRAVLADREAHDGPPGLQLRAPPGDDGAGELGEG